MLGSLASVDSEALRCRHKGKVLVVEVLSCFSWRLKSGFLLHRRGGGVSGLKVCHVSV